MLEAWLCCLVFSLLLLIHPLPKSALLCALGGCLGLMHHQQPCLLGVNSQGHKVERLLSISPAPTPLRLPQQPLSPTPPALPRLVILFLVGVPSVSWKEPD